MKFKEAALVLFMIIMFNCSSKERNMIQEPVKINHMTEQRWQKLEKKKIFFGHQSVGYNIIKGIERDLGKDSPVHVINSKNPAEFIGPGLYHAPIGQNVFPKSKIDEFVALMDGGLAEKTDIAGFKFCYADIRVESDIKEIFKDYTSQMDYLIKKYPQVTFIHFTVPILVKPTGIKGIVKKLFYDHNIKRNAFSRMLLDYYGPDRIFNIAAYEASYPDGKLNTYANGRMAMVTSYSDDGEHINDSQSNIIGEQFLVFLADLPANSGN